MITQWECRGGTSHSQANGADTLKSTVALVVLVIFGCATSVGDNLTLTMKE